MIVRITAVEAISVYQKYVSPYKGFCCAHHALHRRGSCSDFAKKIVPRFGLLRSLPLMWRRFKLCRSAYQTLLAQANQTPDQEPMVIDGHHYGDCPIRPYSKDCYYCGYFPCFCF